MVGSYMTDLLTELALLSPDVASVLVGNTLNLVDLWMAECFCHLVSCHLCFSGMRLSQIDSVCLHRNQLDSSQPRITSVSASINKLPARGTLSLRLKPWCEAMRGTLILLTTSPGTQGMARNYASFLTVTTLRMKVEGDTAVDTASRACGHP